MKIFAIAGTFFQTSERLSIRHHSETEGGTAAVLTQESMSYAFSGHFSAHPRGNCYGQMLDAYGPSTLEGALTEDRFSFVKTYLRTGNNVWYNYQKSRRGIWVGTYDGDHVSPGTTRCILTELEESLFSLNPPMAAVPQVTYPG